MKHLPLKNIIGLCIGLTLSASVLAKTTADGAWARATVPGQNMGGAFVTLTSDRDAQLIGATSPVAEKMELHTMKMEGEKMLMAQVSSIPLPANCGCAIWAALSLSTSSTCCNTITANRC